MYKPKKAYFYGTGRRKSSVARVRLIPGGTGHIVINNREIDNYFGLDTLKTIVRQPLEAVGVTGQFDLDVKVQGGGFTGQAGAIRFGLYACSPEDSSFTAVFSQMQMTQCQWQAHDGQQPD